MGATEDQLAGMTTEQLLEVVKDRDNPLHRPALQRMDVSFQESARSVLERCRKVLSDSRMVEAAYGLAFGRLDPSTAPVVSAAIQGLVAASVRESVPTSLETQPVEPFESDPSLQEARSDGRRSDQAAELETVFTAVLESAVSTPVLDVLGESRKANETLVDLLEVMMDMVDVAKDDTAAARAEADAARAEARAERRLLIASLVTTMIVGVSSIVIGIVAIVVR